MRVTLLLVTITACASVGSDDTDSTGDAIAAGSVEEAGVIGFLNSPAATLDVLDHAAALDTRAATHILAHVTGPDGIRGTADDNQLDSIAELDAIPYVGATALAHLLAYVRSIDGIPQLVEGVMFTHARAAAVVAAANGATLAQIDVDARLDTRAANAIVAARPLADLAAVAAAAYVGKDALQKLRAWAPTWVPPVTGGGGSETECRGLLQPRADANVDDWNTILEDGTTGDFPFAEIATFQTATCVRFGDASQLATIAQIAALAIHWNIDPSAVPPLTPFVPGMGGWVGLVASEQDALESHATNGWDPTANPTDAAIWGRRATIYQALTAPTLGTDAIDLATDADECSEQATIVLDRGHGLVFVTHRFPRC